MQAIGYWDHLPKNITILYEIIHLPPTFVKGMEEIVQTTAKGLFQNIKRRDKFNSRGLVR